MIEEFRPYWGQTGGFESGLNCKYLRPLLSWGRWCPGLALVSSSATWTSVTERAGILRRFPATSTRRAHRSAQLHRFCQLRPWFPSGSPVPCPAESQPQMRCPWSLRTMPARKRNPISAQERYVICSRLQEIERPAGGTAQTPPCQIATRTSPSSFETAVRLLPLFVSVAERA